MYSVAAILYKYGFGFDAFIHRATEVWIKRMVLSCQKPRTTSVSIVCRVALESDTHPDFYIDVYSSSFSRLYIAATIILTQTRLGCPIRKSALALWLIPFVPFLPFTSQLHNLALLFTILCVLRSCRYSKADSHKLTAISYNVSILLSLCALLTHPSALR